MARMGLGEHWECLLANDIDPKKRDAYLQNFGPDHFLCGDIGALSTNDCPGYADLAWASFPCQDLSLAGKGSGLAGTRSSTFWCFWRLITELSGEGRKPKSVIVENVCGLLTSNGGEDFKTICRALFVENYRVSAFIVDASHFVPQSRPRLFIIGFDQSLGLTHITSQCPDPKWHTRQLVAAVDQFPEFLTNSWVWLGLAEVETKPKKIIDIVESSTDSVWNTENETRYIISMMSDANKAKLANVMALGTRCIGTIYRRTRIEQGQRIQRAEVRFDGVAGCLRTPGGGSSRQIIIEVEGNAIRTRLMSPREYARLMGLPESYRLPSKLNDAYHLLGDGLAVPVVNHIAQSVLEPALKSPLELVIV